MTVSELISHLRVLEQQGFGDRRVVDIDFVTITRVFKPECDECPRCKTEGGCALGSVMLGAHRLEREGELDHRRSEGFVMSEHGARQLLVGVAVEISPPLDEDCLAELIVNGDHLAGFDPSGESGMQYLAGIVDLATYLGAKVSGVTDSYEIA